MSAYPRPITSIHQVELTTRCNLRCVYCPSPKLDTPVSEGGHGRARVDISGENFEAMLDWATYFDRQGTQGELALTGIGEALLHPAFLDYCAAARGALPNSQINVSTNGLELTEDIAAELAAQEIILFVSLHRPERAKEAIDLGRRYNILAGLNTAFATDSFDWAGALEWGVSAQRSGDKLPCEFLRSGWSVVLADGRITTCCLDSTGAGVVGHVSDAPGSLSLAPWEGDGPVGKVGCESCHMAVPADDEVGATAAPYYMVPLA